jgi:hypothetical protein
MTSCLCDIPKGERAHGYNQNTHLDQSPNASNHMHSLGMHSISEKKRIQCFIQSIMFVRIETNPRNTPQTNLQNSYIYIYTRVYAVYKFIGTPLTSAIHNLSLRWPGPFFRNSILNFK